MSISINWRGAWSGDNTYQVDDAVYYLGSSYISVDINTGVIPSDNLASWNLLAAQGAVGVTGSQGIPGLTGPTGVGAQGLQGVPGDTGQGLTWRNTYDPAITYNAYDCVAYSGSSYICIADGVVGLEPDTNAVQWNVLCDGSSGSSGGSATWGGITGTLSAQTDLQAAIDAKVATSSLATVATSGSYNDLSNKPSIPPAQVQTDWNAATGEGVLLNKPTLATVAMSGSYTDLASKPTLGTAAAQNTTAFDAAGTSAAETVRAEAAEALLVPKTATVNGHALSANVVVSASDLTTGTLPHAQLPALVSGDIPANAANTTGSAATLTTARTINGVSFNGSANITVPAAAATLTGTALPVGITTASGLTTVAGGTFGTAAFTAASAYDAAGAATAAQTAAEAAFTGDVTKTAGSFATLVTKTNGVAFATSATTDTTNASNITSGTVASALLPAMGGSGSSHAAGLVPDPGATAGTTRYLREDATFVALNTGYEMRFSAAAVAMVASTSYVIGAVGEFFTSSSSSSNYSTALQAGTIVAIEFVISSHTAASTITTSLFNVTTGATITGTSTTVVQSATDTPAYTVLTGLSSTIALGDKIQLRITTSSTAPGTSYVSGRVFIK